MYMTALMEVTFTRIVLMQFWLEKVRQTLSFWVKVVTLGYTWMWVFDRGWKGCFEYDVYINITEMGLVVILSVCKD